MLKTVQRLYDLSRSGKAYIVTRTCKHTHTYTQIQTQTHRHTRTHTRARARTHAPMHTMQKCVVFLRQRPIKLFSPDKANCTKAPFPQPASPSGQTLQSMFEPQTLYNPYKMMAHIPPLNKSRKIPGGNSKQRPLKDSYPR